MAWKAEKDGERRDADARMEKYRLDDNTAKLKVGYFHWLKNQKRDSYDGYDKIFQIKREAEDDSWTGKLTDFLKSAAYKGLSMLQAAEWRSKMYQQKDKSDGARQTKREWADKDRLNADYYETDALNQLHYDRKYVATEKSMTEYTLQL